MVPPLTLVVREVRERNLLKI